MTGYTKLFGSILDSTIWQEAPETRLVWITMLAMKDWRQVVEASVPGLAKRAGVSLEACELALEKLEGPDPYSRTKEHEGRRIERVDGGWYILNGVKYRERMSADDRKEYKRVKAAEYRARNRNLVYAAKKAGATKAVKEGLEDAAKQSRVDAGLA